MRRTRLAQRALQHISKIQPLFVRRFWEECMPNLEASQSNNRHWPSLAGGSLAGNRGCHWAGQRRASRGTGASVLQAARSTSNQRGETSIPAGGSKAAGIPLFPEDLRKVTPASGGKKSSNSGQVNKRHVILERRFKLDFEVLEEFLEKLGRVRALLYPISSLKPPGASDILFFRTR